jgi:hypothetical protein
VAVIFGVYDFDESGLLTVDEAVLAMRASIGGLCKLANIAYPLEQEVENIATSVRDRGPVTLLLSHIDVCMYICDHTQTLLHIPVLP